MINRSCVVAARTLALMAVSLCGSLTVGCGRQETSVVQPGSDYQPTDMEIMMRDAAAGELEP